MQNLNKEEKEMLKIIVARSKACGNSWFNNEVKKMVYLGDKAQEQRLRETHNNLVQKVVHG